jgi:hypothetical protein
MQVWVVRSFDPADPNGPEEIEGIFADEESAQICADGITHPTGVSFLGAYIKAYRVYGTDDEKEEN